MVNLGEFSKLNLMNLLVNLEQEMQKSIRTRQLRKFKKLKRKTKLKHPGRLYNKL